MINNHVVLLLPLRFFLIPLTEVWRVIRKTQHGELLEL